MLADEICIAVSHFSLHKDIDIIKPRYHVLAPQHPPFTFEDSRKFFEALKNYTWNYSCFLGITAYPFSYEKLLKQYPELAPRNLYYIDYQESVQLNEDNVNFSETWDPLQFPFVPHTVIFEAIMLARYMGFQEIYLIGCDHNYAEDLKKTTNLHFYSDQSGIDDTKNLLSFTTEEHLEGLALRWRQYRIMKTYLQQQLHIYNATAGGMLDVFPRIELSSLFPDKKCKIPEQKNYIKSIPR